MKSAFVIFWIDNVLSLIQIVSLSENQLNIPRFSYWNQLILSHVRSRQTILRIDNVLQDLDITLLFRDSASNAILYFLIR